MLVRCSFITRINMNFDDVKSLFDDVAAQWESLQPTGRNLVQGGRRWSEVGIGAGSRWIASASAAIDAAFPAGHSIRRSWARLVESESRRFDPSSNVDLEEARGIFDAAATLLRSGRLASLVDAARAETEGELLDQADVLVLAGYLAPAAVLAGGALETHLRRLCVRAGLSWNGAGSLGVYDAT